MKPKPPTGYVLKTPDEGLCADTFSEVRRVVMDRIIMTPFLYREGWRVVKVKLVEVRERRAPRKGKP